MASNGGARDFTLIDDADVLALARKVHDVAPGIALKGVDLVRDPEGKLWILEFNGGGNTWAFSSTIGLRLRVGIGAAADSGAGDLVGAGIAAMKAQFGAFQKAAEVLIARTRREAN